MKENIQAILQSAKDYKDQLIKACEPDLIRDVDGFVKFWPKQAGCLEAHHLRILAAELDKRNADWQKQIDSDPSIGGSNDT